MSLVTRKRRQPSINIVPLVDVLTVLLFFFLVTMQFKQVSALNITAPEIETAGKNKIDENVVIALSSEGEIFYNNAPVTEEELEAVVKIAGEVTPDIPVLLIADEEVSLKFVTKIMDVCRSNRLNKIRLQSR
ncbi:MAG: biopolymer transporter ExbD [Verrucomicrobiota bacterium]